MGGKERWVGFWWLLIGGLVVRLMVCVSWFVPKFVFGGCSDDKYRIIKLA